MTNKLYQGYILFFQKNLLDYVQVINNSTLQIRGVKHKIRKSHLQYLFYALVDTEFIKDIDYTCVKNLYKAMQKANSIISFLYEKYSTKSKKAIELFIQMVEEKSLEKELMAKLEAEFKAINS